MSRPKSIRTSILAASLTLAGCGGGGGGQPPPPVVQPAPVAQFSEVTGSAGISFAVGYSENPGDVFDVPHFAGGVAAGDYDNDGDTDLYVVRGDVGANLLYRNDGNNVFTDVAEAAGVAYTKSSTENFRHSGPVFADMDGDGDLDLFVGGIQGDPSRLFANNGDGSFTDVTAGSGIDTLGAAQNVSAAFGDYDLDGDLDLLIAHWGTARSSTSPGDTEHLWRNESVAGSIRFASASVAANLSPSIMTLPDPRVVATDTDRSFAPSFARINDDRYPDILMVSDFNTTMYFVNNQDGTFSNATDVDVIQDTNGMGSALGDYDNDGDLDWFVSSIFRESGGTVPNGNRLYRNDDGAFSDVTATAGVANGAWGWAACFVDFNNDGLLDIYHTNGWPFEMNGNFSADVSRAFMANGDGTFIDRATAFGIGDSGQGRGVVCADFDNDGDSDVFLWSSEESNGGRLFRNDERNNNYLAVRLVGNAPNTQAIGARIYVTIGAVTQMREITVASNFISQNPTEQIIGLGNAAQVDALLVEWPDGELADLGIVQGNQRLVLNQSAAQP